MIESFLTTSIVGRAQKNNQVEIAIVDIRDFATDAHKSVDDRPYGGGAGMILRVDVLYDALTYVLGQEADKKRSGKVRVLMTSAKGAIYAQKTARKYSKLEHLVIVAGHYEGVDERFLTYVDEEISIGKYVLTGGELPAAVIADSVVRLLPGVLKKDDAASDESYQEANIDELIAITGPNEKLTALKSKGKKTVKLLEYPHYTRPVEFRGVKVPEILMSGDHEKVKVWKQKEKVENTLS